MNVTVEALGPKSARQLLDAGAGEVMIPCIGDLDSALERAARVPGPVTLHVPANRVADPADTATRLRQRGIRRVLAVSGNPGVGPGGVGVGVGEMIEALAGAGLHVSVGAYPENWFSIPGSARRRARSAAILADKQAAGARRIVTQAGFDPRSAIRWLETIRAAGIEVPVHVGVMPALPWQRVRRLAARAARDLLSRGATSLSRPDADLLMRLLRAPVSRPRRYVHEIGTAGVLKPGDSFHVFAQGVEAGELLAACRRSASPPVPDGTLGAHEIP
jgi:methylenetetrahydrofolate reductase (NADPH)